MDDKTREEGAAVSSNQATNNAETVERREVNNSGVPKKKETQHSHLCSIRTYCFGHGAWPYFYSRKAGSN